MRLYLASPIFAPRDRAFVAAVGARLRAKGHEVFLPAETFAPPPARPSLREREATFEANVRELQAADAVVAILDGADADSGTAFEVGVAWSRCVPVVGVRTDYRTLGPEGSVNLMLERACSVLLALPDAPPARVADAVARILDTPLLPPGGKLVRDRLPSVVRAQGRRATSRRVRSPAKREALLLRKLAEEVGELGRARGPRERARELCDLWEALRAYADLHGLGARARREQVAVRERLGGYGGGVVLTRLSGREPARRRR
ncbi:MAG TPA: nucleoside 2-deoxyribosyltransferase [Candidatus Thermoplasmatota archaeon]|nr:nucleoside 2-deoxyribosyltransferase [Candidatus Thermoplasmatota archaeon]